MKKSGDREFLFLQYQALREEILATQKRGFQTIGIGVVALPAINYLAQLHAVEELVLTLPFMVIVLAMFYLGDNQAIIRCGQFIRRRLETQFAGDAGWETWLEANKPNGTRSTEACVTFAVGLLLLIYFAGATYLAWPVARKAYGENVAVTMTALYVAFGLSFGIFFAWSLRTSTTTRDEESANRL